MSSAPSAAPSHMEIIAARGTPANAGHIRLGYAAFNAGQYEQAMMYFQLTEADPLQVISLFPNVLPSALVAAAAAAADGLPAPPLPPSSPFARLRLPPHPVPITNKIQGEENVMQALYPLLPYLAQIQNRLRLSLKPKQSQQQQQQSHSQQHHSHLDSTNHHRRTDEDTDHGDEEEEGIDMDEDPALAAIPTKRRAGATATTTAASSTAAAAAPPSSEEYNLALAILVDTALLKAYLQCDIPLMPFLTPDNLCDVEECANILMAHEKWTELLTFYKHRARHEQALELLRKQGQQSLPLSVSSVGVIGGVGGVSGSGAGSAEGSFAGTEATIKYLQELACNINQPCYPLMAQQQQQQQLQQHQFGAHGATDDDGTGLPGSFGVGSVGASSPGSRTATAHLPASSLDSSPRTIIHLILHYARWPLEVSVDDGLRIFTFCHTMNLRPIDSGVSSSKRAGAGGHSHPSSSVGGAPIVHSYHYHQSNCIPASLVLSLLKECADVEACIAYLESLIRHVGETNAYFHNELIFLYLQSINKIIEAQRQREQRNKQQQQQQQAAALAAGSGNAEAGDNQLNSISDVPVRARGGSKSAAAHALTAPLSSPASGLSTRDSSRLRILRTKLLDFLRSSRYYTPEKMLSKFPKHALLEERAILLSRVNQHVQALNIYAHRLHDPLQAEAYAEAFWTAATAPHAIAAAVAAPTGVPAVDAAVAAAAAAAAAASSSASAALPSAAANGGAGGGGAVASPFAGVASAAEGRDMYLKLLQVYLKPPPAEPAERLSNLSKSLASGGVDGAAAGGGASASGAGGQQPQPMLDAALGLLRKYFDRISPLGALESLPPETPLQALWPYLEKLLCHTCHTLRHEQISKQLLKAEYYAMKELWLEAARGRVVVDSSTSCAKCHKKLGSSAFARYPNGHIVHYGCHQKTMAAQSTLLMPKGDL